MRGVKRAARSASALRFTVHPLFLLFGAATAFTGQLFAFLAATVAAVEHECAHAFAARRFGFSLDRVVLMPYGAVISGDLSGMTPKQELAVCAAGPLVNAVTALFFAALWWLYPETYPYTDVAAQVSLSLAVVNLIPAFPLDGGRVLRVFLRPIGARRSKIVCTAVSLLFAAAGAVWFAFGCAAGKPQWTLLAFCVFLAAGSRGGGKYSRVRFSREKALLRGVEERRIAISADRTAGYAVRFLRDDKYTVFALYENEEFCGELTEEEFLKGAESQGWDCALGELLRALENIL